MDLEKSEKYKEAYESLPESLRPIFRQLVEEYSYHTQVIYGRRYVSYIVLAELVRAGWTPPEGTVKDR